MYWAASGAALPGYSIAELADTLYALGVLGETPPEDWVEEYMEVGWGGGRGRGGGIEGGGRGGGGRRDGELRGAPEAGRGE